MPATPRKTLPFITATAATARDTSTERTIVGAPESVEKGRKPISSRPPTIAATITASTERRPSSAQYTSSRWSQSAYSSSVSPAPMPKPGRHQLHPRAAELEREHEAAEEHQHDAEHEMVDVQPALGLDAARPPGRLRAAHEPRAYPDEQEREKQGPEDDQPGAFALAVEDALVLELENDLGDVHWGYCPTHNSHLVNGLAIQSLPRHGQRRDARHRRRPADRGHGGLLRA